MAHEHHDHDHADHHGHADHAHNPAKAGRGEVAALSLRATKIRDYIPLIVVFSFIGLSSSIYVYLLGNTELNWLNAIMGFFFLYFALFKFLDLPGFVEGYHEYDILARRAKWYGWVYPFIEVTLALLYLIGVVSLSLYLITIIITVINVWGVSLKLAKREKFMCACLGTFLKVPLTTVTIVEYGLMGLMAVYMLGDALIT